MAESGAPSIPEWSEQLGLHFNPTETNFDDLVDMTDCFTDINFENLKFYEQSTDLTFGPSDGAQFTPQPMTVPSGDLNLFDFPSASDKFTSKSTVPPPNQFPLPRHPSYVAIPPTPNSGQVSGFVPNHVGSQQHQPQGQQQQMPPYAGNMDFTQLTPLVSPAVSSAEDRSFLSFGYAATPHYTPLTSPALVSEPAPVSGTAALRGIPSIEQGPSRQLMVPMQPPEDILMADSRSVPAPAATTNRPQNSKRKSVSSSRPANPARSKQSPIVKPMRRKASVLAVSSADLQTLLDNSLTASSSSAAPAHDHTSPSHLDIGVPQMPAMDIRNTGYLGSDIFPGANTQPQAVAPATPSSLLSLGRTPAVALGSSNMAPQRQDTVPDIDELVLPDPMAKPDAPAKKKATPPAVHPSRSSTSSVTSQNTSPTFGPLPTMMDLSKASSSSSHSRGGKSSAIRKRGSNSASAFVSPALRPKISPAIKPLLPKDSPLSPEAHTLLLASKSNFQRILDGSILPGSFPDDLTREIHSKRASHKLAEQGRRNRINSALMELQGLLPNTDGGLGGSASVKSSPEIVPNRRGGERDGGCNNADMVAAASSSSLATPTSAKQSNGKAGAVQLGGQSKASTVESAIVYIRQLQRDAEARELEFEAKTRETEGLQERIAELTRLLAAQEGNQKQGHDGSDRSDGRNPPAADEPAPGGVGHHRPG